MAGENDQVVNPLDLDDAAFLQTSPPPVTKEESVQDPPVVENDDTELPVEQDSTDGDKAAETEEELETEQPEQEKKPSGEENPEGGTLPQDKSGEGKQPLANQEKDGRNAPAPAGSEAAQEPDYKAFYEKVTKPFVANGKTIDIKSPEELIQLAQMGANYTRKMQALAPHRKVLLMLENNGLLDEGKLNFLIDIEKKNPEAIKQLIKSAGIDPHDIDLEDPNAKAYLPGNHSVSDAEAGFRTALDELSSNPEGKVTLQTIHTQWDQASKDMLWKNPEVMAIIHEQRANGLYDRITAEVERLRTFGQIPANVPFLHAYKTIGDQLANEGKLDDIIKPKPVVQGSPVVEKTPVISRAAKPKPAVTNGDKVQAAASSRTTPKTAKTAVNPLALSDEEFMKQHMEQFAGRV